MDEPTLRIVLVILGIMISIIGYFLTFYFKRSVESIDKLNDTVGELRGSITGLKAQMIANEEMSSMRQEGCKDRHSIIDTRLREHGEQLDEHEKKIARIEIKIGIPA
jgi:hypothetical protein